MAISIPGIIILSPDKAYRNSARELEFQLPLLGSGLDAGPVDRKTVKWKIKVVKWSLTVIRERIVREKVWHHTCVDAPEKNSKLEGKTEKEQLVLMLE